MTLVRHAPNGLKDEVLIILAFFLAIFAAQSEALEEKIDCHRLLEMDQQKPYADPNGYKLIIINGDLQYCEGTFFTPKSNPNTKIIVTNYASLGYTSPNLASQKIFVEGLGLPDRTIGQITAIFPDKKYRFDAFSTNKETITWETGVRAVKYRLSVDKAEIFGRVHIDKKIHYFPILLKDQQARKTKKEEHILISRYPGNLRTLSAYFGEIIDSECVAFDKKPEGEWSGVTEDTKLKLIVPKEVKSPFCIVYLVEFIHEGKIVLKKESLNFLN